MTKLMLVNNKGMTTPDTADSIMEAIASFHGAQITSANHLISQNTPFHFSLSTRPDIDLLDPLVELGLLQFRIDASEDVSELLDGDQELQAGGVLAKDLEGVAELTIEGGGLHVLANKVKEVREVEEGRELLLDDNGFELGLGRVDSKRTH
ncbi:hypothetical protein ACE6H2_005276 [Prunus campanulata]